MADWYEILKLSQISHNESLSQYVAIILNKHDDADNGYNKRCRQHIAYITKDLDFHIH